MKYELDKRENLTIFKLEEERLDAAITSQLKGEFVVLTQADSILNLLVDLSDVTFADSSGLSSLLMAHRAVTSAGGLFGIVGATGAVEKLIGISHLDRVFLMYDKLDDAVTDFEIQLEEMDEEEEDPFYDEDLENYQLDEEDEEGDELGDDATEEFGDDLTDDLADDKY